MLVMDITDARSRQRTDPTGMVLLLVPLVLTVLMVLVLRGRGCGYASARRQSSPCSAAAVCAVAASAVPKKGFTAGSTTRAGFTIRNHTHAVGNL